jgi:hypothetical protein
MLFNPITNIFNNKELQMTGRPVAAQGASITSANGSKGSWYELLPSSSYDSYGIIININSNAVSATARTAVLDIGIGASSAESVILADLIVGNATGYATLSGGIWYFFPLFIPAGSRISARSAANNTSSFRVNIKLLQQPSYIHKFCSEITTYGITSLNGVLVTPGTTSEGEWFEIGTLSSPKWFWQIGAQVDTSDTTHSSAPIHLDLAIGDASTKQIIFEDLLFTTTAGEAASIILNVLEAYFPLSSGTLYVRAQAGGTFDDLRIAVYAGGD